MGLYNRCIITLTIIFHSLIPPATKKSGPVGAAVKPGASVPSRHLSPEELRYLCADFTRSLDSNGNLTLFFPGCLFPAAPFLLFRLKRRGFSNCRAYVENGGLFLTALR